jgi:hypothetical protein
MMRERLILLGVGAVAFLSGCRGKDQRLQVVPVKGKLLLQEGGGKLTPVTGARIMFNPIKDGDSFPAFPAGTTAADGSFKLGTYEENDGAPEGEYVVTIDWRRRSKPKHDIMGKGEVAHGPDLLGGAYGDRNTSELRATVVGGKDLSLVVSRP